MNQLKKMWVCVCVFMRGCSLILDLKFDTSLFSLFALPNRVICRDKQNHVKITSISRYRLEESYVLQTPDIYVNVLIRLLH